MRRTFTILTALAVLAAALCGCGGSQAKLQEAKTAENSGDHRKAANIYAALALELSPTYRLMEAQKGKVIPAPTWIAEAEKYIAWLTDAATPRDAAGFREALDGLTRSAKQFEADNTAHTAVSKNLDSLNAFAPQWNSAFNQPRDAGPDDWNAVIRRAHEKKFSVLRLSSPKNYVYEVSIVSRKNARRVNFTLFSESQIFAPLPPGDYSVIIRSTVEFQKGTTWTSDYTVFNVTMTEERALTAMDIKTKVARRE
ncbi:MAG: hypothetical protein FWB85_08490 [Chitinispirillia bacterium]|nr:hypothetical protein [Chitinispirillia bacterium]MCL2242281.1 hypothetical protein [Chitinispirillia bacterium]